MAMNKLFDFRTEPYKDYLGVGNAPQDYDEYWSRARAELGGASLEYELVKADFECGCAEAYDLYFTGVGSARIHCQLLKPKGIAAKTPAVLLFHGYWTNSGDWSSKLGHVAEGFTVLAMDVRGQGGTSLDTGIYKGNTQSGHIIRGVESDSPDELFYRNVFLDTAQAADILASMDFVDETRIFATGASQGGALTIACAALSDKLRGAAAVYPYLCDFRGVYQNSFSGGTYEELIWFFRQRDPLHEREELLFERLGYIDLKNIVRYIRCDVLWFTGLMDNVCPPFAQMAAYNGIRSEKELVYFPEYGHEYIPFSGDKIHAFFRKRL